MFVLIQFVLLPGQVEVRVGSLATVALPAGRGGVKRRECGAGGGGGGGGSRASPGLRGGQAVPAAQTLIGNRNLQYKCFIHKLKMLLQKHYHT